MPKCRKDDILEPTKLVKSRRLPPTPENARFGLVRFLPGGGS